MKTLSILSISIACSAAPLFAQSSKRDWDFDTGVGGLSLESPDRKFEFQLGGRLHLDFAGVDDDVTQFEDGYDVRRLRIDGTWRYDDRWTARLDYDFGGIVEGWYGAWLRYEAAKPWYFTFGNVLVPFGLENATSSNDVTFLERSQLGALRPGFAVGAQAQHRGERTSSLVGVFGNELDVGPARRSDGVGLFGRHTREVWREGDSLWHVGASAELRDIDGGSDYRMRTRPEIGIVDRRLIDSRTLNDVDRSFTLGFESALQLGPLSFQGEWIGAELARDSQDVSFSGWYLQASYFLDGRTRRYRADRGEFTDPSGLGERSAWELAARISQLDLQDGDVTGGEGRNFTLGVNWYVDRNIRLMLNYVNADASPNRNGVEENVNAIALRFQLAF